MQFFTIHSTQQALSTISPQVLFSQVLSSKMQSVIVKCASTPVQEYIVPGPPCVVFLRWPETLQFSICRVYRKVTAEQVFALNTQLMTLIITQNFAAKQPPAACIAFVAPSPSLKACQPIHFVTVQSRRKQETILSELSFSP
jgi:hypothetical protein